MSDEELRKAAKDAYRAMVEQKDSDGYVWLGFDNEQDAYESGWVDGSKATGPIDGDAVRQYLRVISGAVDDMMGNRPVEDAVGEIGTAADAALALLGSEASRG